MKDNNINSEDLSKLIEKQEEVLKRVGSGKLPIAYAIASTQDILDRKSPANKNKLSQFAHLLRPLSVQAQELRKINKEMPRGMRVPDLWFDNLDTDSKHVQMIEDLEFYFIVPSCVLEEVIKYQVKLVELTQSGIFRTDNFDENVKVAYLDETADKSMFLSPGIYRRRINLVSYRGCMFDPPMARQQALADGVSLAGLAAVGAYAAQDPELYQQQNGEDLPYFDMPELHSGTGGSYVFLANWYGHSVAFMSTKSDYVSPFYACPSFV